MGALDRASDILREAESELRTLLQESAKAGDYRSVVRIAEWARSIGEIAAHSSVVRASPTKTDLPNTKVSTAPNGTKLRSGRKTSSNGYPRFYRQGDRLIRVSWSKSERKEYEHKAPVSVLRILADRVAASGSDGRVFSTDELIPATDSDGTEIPNYQVYASLALLKQVGLVDQHGRQGYSVPRIGEFRTAVDALWQNLPVR